MLINEAAIHNISTCLATMASLSQATAFVAMVILLAAAAAPSWAAITCSDVIKDLRPCLNYLKSGSGAPPTPCCDGASSLAAAASTTADKQAACNCLKNAAKSITLKPELAKALPANCGISMPFQISPNVDCSKIS
ncbi:non-specific lipid-transfer protein 8-like [Salvia miltiorrhiza]|uniref:non-specific lipid-transfer protein 8-like n=1 Tax=Salvia miltiorrhiza TaxID=226208 RepID=UPI0025AD2838|nr:non-specific lipid-transfer protein 8-like [Salvia miltiorrhiza]